MRDQVASGPATSASRALLLIAALFAGTAARADIDYGLDLGFARSDNITRVDGDEIDENIASVGFDAVWAQNSRRLQADVVADLSYSEYLEDAYDGEVLGTANADLLFGIVPETFTWALQDSFGQAQTDPFQPSTPGTRENLNYLTTGPDVTLRLGVSNSIRLLGRYSVTNFEDSPLDSTSTSGGLALARRLSGSSEISLQAFTEQVDFDDEENTDYDRDSLTLRYDLRATRTVLSADVGYAWIELDNAADKQGGVTANVSILRELTRASTLQFSIGRRTSDAGDSLRGSLQGGAGLPDVISASDPFENTSATVGWTLARNRTRVSLGASWNDEEYETQTELNRRRIEYRAQLSRRLSRSLDFDLSGELFQEDFDNTDFEADDLQFGAGLMWRLGRTLGLSLRLERFERDTSTGTGEFAENRATLSLTVRPRGFDFSIESPSR